ncbi:MAG: SMC family ATPase, partial [Planctomycetes bacterium]|nr:SMC family ATPase [Planctomycetota bacterium]
MILRSLEGKNFMKFRHVRLEAIPRRGLFCIEGPNESGKTSIGELIQFALFGKSHTSAEGSLADLIHWGEQQCSVALEFEQTDPTGARRYLVSREIDRLGTNYARLSCLDDRREIAAGTSAVDEALRGVLRLDFEDYCRSFYMAESDAPRSPQEMREFLDHIVGCDVLENSRAAVCDEIGDAEGEFARIQAELTRNELQISKYVPNVARIPELMQARVQHAQRAVELHEAERSRAQNVAAEEKELKERERLRDRLRQAASKPLLELSAFLQPIVRAEVPAAAGAQTGHPRLLAAGLGELVEEYRDVCRSLDTEIANAREHLYGDRERSLPRLEGAAERRRRRAARRSVRGRILGRALVAASVASLVIWIGDVVEIIAPVRALADSWGVAAST